MGTMAPIKQDLDVRLTYTADLIPNQLVNIFSRVDGYIAKIYVDKGDLVKASQLLVEIDHTDYIHVSIRPISCRRKRKSSSRMRRCAMPPSRSTACKH